MANTVTIATRIDPQQKAQATKIVEGLGLDLSSVVRAFIHQITLQKRIPLDLTYPETDETDDEDPGYDPEFVRMVLESDASYDPNSKTYASAQEAFDDILGKGWDA
jgi:addiction module RelB/DinJ family antitoxin